MLRATLVASLSAGYFGERHFGVNARRRRGWREKCYGSRLTGMIQMLAQFHVTMPSRGDVEVPLHLVSLQASINPTTRRWHAPSPPGRFLESSLFLPMSQYMPHMSVLLLLLREVLPLSVQRIDSLVPLLPIRSVLCQHIASEYTIARCILDVDVQVRTKHWDHDVEVNLQFMRDAFLDAKEMGFMAGVPTAKLGKGEDGADKD